MTNDKKRTGEIWQVTYSSGEVYLYKISRSWKFPKSFEDDGKFQYKAIVLETTDDTIPNREYYVGGLFNRPGASYFNKTLTTS